MRNFLTIHPSIPSESKFKEGKQLIILCRYIESEADLFAAVASFTVLSEHPELYPVLVSSGAFERLVSLFAHENIDIAISVLEVLIELSGEDVELKEENDMQVLIDSLFKNDAIEVMIGNLERLDESKDDDQKAVFHTLSTTHRNTESNDSDPREYHIFFTTIC